MASDWRVILKEIAPTMAQSLNGPLAKSTILKLGEVLGIGDDATQDQVADAIRVITPEQIVELKKSNTEFEQQLSTLKIDLKRLNSHSTESIDDDEEGSNINSLAPKILTFGAVGIFFAVMLGTFALAFMPGLDIKNEVAYMLGGLQSASAVLVQNCYNYYFGNNSESGIRDQMIYNAKPIVEQKTCPSKNNNIELG